MVTPPGTECWGLEAVRGDETNNIDMKARAFLAHMKADVCAETFWPGTGVGLRRFTFMDI